MLKLKGIDLVEEGPRLATAELLTEVLELQMELEENPSTDRLLTILRTLSGREEACASRLARAFASGDLDQASKDTVEMQYLRRMRADVNGRLPDSVTIGTST